VNRRRILVGLGLLALAGSASASALVIPQKSIGGARIGMSETRVKAKLGAPLRVRSGSNDFGYWRTLVYKNVSVSFQTRSKATSVRTTSKSERTAHGVGVGSTLAEVRAGLSGETCKREFGIHHCWLGNWDAGRVITEFRLEKNRVSVVTISLVID
jgi:hypothetical protein